MFDGIINPYFYVHGIRRKKIILSSKVPSVIEIYTLFVVINTMHRMMHFLNYYINICNKYIYSCSFDLKLNILIFAFFFGQMRLIQGLKLPLSK
jgi:hypothetical protein